MGNNFISLGNGLTQRGPIFYFRRRIPKDLMPFFKGKREVRVSLRTDDLAQAKVLVKAVEARFNDQIVEARRLALVSSSKRDPLLMNATMETIDALANVWLYLARIREYGDHGSVIDDPDYLSVEDIQRFVRDELNVVLQMDVVFTDDRLFVRFAKAKDALIAETGKYCRYMPGEIDLNPLARMINRHRLGDGIVTLSDLLQDWLRSETAKRIKSTGDYRHAMDALIEDIGDLMLVQVTYSIMLGYRDRLLQRLAPRTVRKQIGMIGMVMEYARGKDLIAGSPCKNVIVHLD